jgi:hypothetical protein
MEKLLGLGSFLCFVAMLLIGLGPVSSNQTQTNAWAMFSVRDMQQENERGARLERELVQGEEFRQARADSLERYRAGVIDLDKLMSEFRALNERQPLLLQVIQLNYRGRTEEQYLGFQLLVAAQALDLENGEREAFIRELIITLNNRLGGEALIPDAVAHLAPKAPA